MSAFTVGRRVTRDLASEESAAAASTAHGGRRANGPILDAAEPPAPSGRRAGPLVDAPPPTRVRPTAAAPQNPAQVQQGALAAITNLIPGEGITVYIGVYSLVLAGFTGTDGTPSALLAFGVVVVAAAVNLLSMVVGARQFSVGLSAEGRAAARVSLVWRGLGITLLFLIVIVATPANPFAMFLQVPLATGTICAVIAAVVIGILNRPAAVARRR